MSSVQYSIAYEEYGIPYFGSMIGSLGKRYDKVEDAIKFIEDELNAVLSGDESFPGCAVNGKVWIHIGNHSYYWIEKLIYDENGRLKYRGA